MQTTSSRTWTRISVSILSNDNPLNGVPSELNKKKKKRKKEKTKENIFRGLNSNFSFSYTGYQIKVKEPSLPYY